MQAATAVVYPNSNASQGKKIELFISCRDLKDLDVMSKSDPFAIVEVRLPGQGLLKEIGRTEVVRNNLNPNFAKSFELDYFFELRQEVRIVVQDQDEGNERQIIGVVQTTIGDIVGARGGALVADLTDEKGHAKKRGRAILRAESVSGSNDVVHMAWGGRKLLDTDFFTKSDPLLRIYRLSLDGTVSSDKDLVLVYESEYIKDNLNPDWKPFTLSLQKLCAGDTQRLLRAECWDWESNGSYQFIGKTDFTLDDIVTRGRKEFDLSHPKHKKSTGKLVVLTAGIERVPSFLDYVFGGVQLNLVLAVDFTGSNGDPRHSHSLHHVSQNGALNQYQQAIWSVGEILLAYDYDKQVPCFGFGARLNFPQMKTPGASHLFPLTGNAQNPYALGVNGLLQAYAYALQCVDLSGPTNFESVVREAVRVGAGSQQTGSMVYTVLLILTDGEVTDFQQTINAVVDASGLPVSIVIVGVGDANFGKMERLDGDTGTIANSQGVKARRDIVQFVPFRKFNGNGALLAQEVLAEIPNQVVQYYKQINMPPPARQAPPPAAQQ